LKRQTILVLVIGVLFVAFLLASEAAFAAIQGDFEPDGDVDFRDFSVLASSWLSRNGEVNWNPACDISQPNDSVIDELDLAVFAQNWLAGDVVVMVSIPGKSWKMGKYPVTNAQYCEYLNFANTAGLIKLVNGIVYASSDGSNSQPYFSTSSAPSGAPDYGEYSQIDYVDGVFSIGTKDGYDRSNHPVVCVSYYGATAFCDYYGYRLPTEDEWEYAARGGLTGMKYPWGDTWDNSRANSLWSGDNYESGSPPRTTPVDYYPAQNAYGLYDMAGNVWEWINSCYHSDCRYNYRVLHGGCWDRIDLYARITFRRMGPDLGFRYCGYGFRVVLDLN